MEGRQAPSTGQDHAGLYNKGGEAFEAALQEMIMWWERHVSHKEPSQKRHGGRNWLECAQDLGDFASMVRAKERLMVCAKGRRHEARRSCGSVCVHPGLCLNQNRQLVHPVF